MKSYDLLDFLQYNVDEGVDSSTAKTRLVMHGTVSVETGWWVHWDLLGYSVYFCTYLKTSTIKFFFKVKDGILRYLVCHTRYLVDIRIYKNKII